VGLSMKVFECYKESNAMYYRGGELVYAKGGGTNRVKDLT